MMVLFIRCVVNGQEGIRSYRFYKLNVTAGLTECPTMVIVDSRNNIYTVTTLT